VSGSDLGNYEKFSKTVIFLKKDEIFKISAKSIFQSIKKRGFTERSRIAARLHIEIKGSYFNFRRYRGSTHN
jgi:hypothetical protein